MRYLITYLFLVVAESFVGHFRFDVFFSEEFLFELAAAFLLFFGFFGTSTELVAFSFFVFLAVFFRDAGFFFRALDTFWLVFVCLTNCFEVEASSLFIILLPVSPELAVFSLFFLFWAGLVKGSAVSLLLVVFIAVSPALR